MSYSTYHAKNIAGLLACAPNETMLILLYDIRLTDSDNEPIKKRERIRHIPIHQQADS